MTGNSLNRIPQSVLIIDDEEGVREGLTYEFEKSTTFDFKVVTAESPREILDKGLLNDDFDVIIIDLRLTHGSDSYVGFLIVEHQNRKHPGSLIIVLTAHDDKDNIVKAMQLGATDFISKRSIMGQYEKCVEQVEQCLLDAHNASERSKAVDDFVAKNLNVLMRKFKGQVVAISDADVVASGSSFFEAAINYEDYRNQSNDSNLPEQPELVLIPALN